MSRKLYTFAAVASAALIAGCGSVADVAPGESYEPPAVPTVSEQADPVQDTEPTTTTPIEPQTNERGNIVASLGEPISLINPGGQTYATVKVTSLKFEQCTNYMGETHTPLVMRYNLTTSPDATNSDLLSVFNPFDMTLFNAESGVTEQRTMMPKCMKLSNELSAPMNMSPGSKYTGGVLFNEAPESGAVIYAPAFMANGVEWQY